MNQYIRKLYDELVNPGNALSEDEFLDKLIKFESCIKSNIYRTLLSKNDKESVRKSKEYRAIKSLNPYSVEQVKKDNSIRNRLEKNAINNLVGEKVSIRDIIDIYSRNINNILKQKVDIKEKLKQLNITYHELEWVILPPEWEERIITWSWKWVDKKEWFDRFSLLLEKVLNADNWFYTWDYRVVIWNNRKNMMRETSYIVIEIPKINKTIFVNNEYWEATFIYDWIPFDSEIQEKWKLSYKSEFNKIRFLDPVQWVEQVKEWLFKTREWEENKFKNIEAKNLKDSLNREEFLEGAREYLENNLEEKIAWLSADNSIKRNNLKIIIKWRTYKWGSIVSHIFNEISCYKAKAYFASPKWYIEVLKSIFWEKNEEVNSFITEIEWNREEFIKGARKYFENNPEWKAAWLSADLWEKRNNLKIIINWRTYKWRYIVSHIFNEVSSDKAQAYFRSPKWYIEVLKSIFWEDNPDVKKLIATIEWNTKENLNREEFIKGAREYLENNLEEKSAWLSADSQGKRNNLKITINWRAYKWASIVLYIFNEVSSDKAHAYFVSPKWYIEVLKSIFWEKNEEVNSFITEIEWNTKEDLNREEFIKGAREYLENNLEEKSAWLNADTQKKRKNLKIVINWRTYKWRYIVSHIFNEISSDKAQAYFVSPKWYIEVLKSIFWEKNEEVNSFITEIEWNTKENLNREEFIKGAREYLENNPEEKIAWLSADNSIKREKLKIIINWRTYKLVSIASRIFSEISSDKAKAYFASPKWYIEVLKSIFWKDNPDVKKLIATIEWNTKEDLNREEFISGAREYLENNLEEKSAWLSAYNSIKREKLKIIINWRTYKLVSIASRIFSEISSDKAKAYFLSPKWYIEVLKSIFWKDNPDVIKLMNKK